tara:strand:+ start:538 stop:654 length:117 start_codon:yes stop_codon:yes gene_type:complete
MLYGHIKKRNKIKMGVPYPKVPVTEGRSLRSPFIVLRE